MTAFVVELAGVAGHGFRLSKAAVRAGQHGFKNDVTHITSAPSRDSRRLWLRASGLPVWSCPGHR